MEKDNIQETEDYLQEEEEYLKETFDEISKLEQEKDNIINNYIKELESDKIQELRRSLGVDVAQK